MHTRTDAELLNDYVSTGDEAAFGELMTRYGAFVHRTCFRLLKDEHEAQDACQAVFLVLARKACRLRRGDLSAWLYRVGHLVAAETARKRMRRAQLRYLRGHSQEEAARLAGCSVSALSVRASRGIEAIRRRLGRRGLVLGAPVLAAALESEAQAAIPETVLASTMAAVKAYAAGGAAAAAVSTNVAVLTKGVLNMMFWSSVKTAAIAVALTGAVIGTATVVAQKTMDDIGPAAVAAKTDTQQQQTEDSSKAITTFSEADSGKTVTIPVGQLFEVHLTNDREGAGWEPGATEITGKSVVRVDNLRRMNCDEFVPADPSTNSTKGTYIYRYKAATAGESNLRLTHLYPSGPKPVARYATMFIGEFKLTIVVADRDQAGGNSAGDRALDDPALAAAVKGEKVLVQFWHYPLVNHPNGPSDEEIADGRKNIGGKIAQALKVANVEVVRFLWGQDGKEGADQSSYSAMALLDCKGRRPEEALANVPHRVAGIVFKDGVYERALPVETESRWLVTAKKGQVPAPYAFYHKAGSYGDIQQGKQDVERFRTIPGVHVEALPPSGAIPGGWRAKMTPTSGHTLLEVFVLTEAGFLFVDPN